MDTTILAGTIVFLVLWIIVSIIICIIATKNVNDARLKGEYRGKSLSLTFLGAFCMWLMWISVFMHQMNPLISPIVKPLHPTAAVCVPCPP